MLLQHEYLLIYNNDDNFDKIIRIKHKITGTEIDVQQYYIDDADDITDLLLILERRATTMQRCFGSLLRPKNEWGEG